MAKNFCSRIKLRELGYQSYSQYLSSEHWQDLRQRFFRSKLPVRIDGRIVCSFCRHEGRFHLHHRTYKRLGEEKLSDLVIICEACHKIVHKAHRLKTAGKSLWKTTTQIGRECRKPSDRHLKQLLRRAVTQ